MTILLGALAACSDEFNADVALYDAPPEGVTAVSLYIASIQAHVVPTKNAAEDSDPNDSSIDDDSSWKSVTVDRAIDLVQHQGETAADVLGRFGLPAGKITQLRLVIDTTKPNTATLNGTPCDLDMSAVSAKGIKINHVFKAFESKKGKSGQIFMELDLADSMTPKDGCFKFEPKLKLHKVKIDDVDQTI